jgi:hypothetical protein
MKIENSNNITREILTSVSLVGCFLNMLTLVHDLYLFTSKDYIAEYLYLGILSVTTLLCLYGILKLREGETAGFRFYLYGQIGEFVYYSVVLIFITIPEFKKRMETDSFLASAGFVKNIIPLVLMTVLHYFSVKKSTQLKRAA